MRIDNREQDNAREIKRLQNQERDKIAALQAQNVAMGKYYDKSIESMKSEGIKRLAQTHENLQKEEIEALEQNKVKLEGYKKNLTETQHSLGTEEQLLKKGHLERFTSLNEMYKDKYEQHADKSATVNNEIEEKTNQFIGRLNQSSKRQIASVAQIKAKELNEAERASDRKIADQAKMHEIQVATKRQEIKQTEEMAKLEHAKSMQTLLFKQQQREKEQDKNFSKGLEGVKAHYADLLKQQTAAFEQRYQGVVANHEELIKTLDSKMQSDIAKIKDSQSTVQARYNKMEQDPFYQIRELDPSVKEEENHYIVSLAIPQYEQESVHFTGRDRMLKMTLTRRFDDEKKDSETGISDRSRRTEVLVKEIAVPDLVNNKSITTSYQDGMLFFKIAKL